MIKQYLTSLLAFILIDGLWLGFVAPSFYREHIGHLMRPEPNLTAASLFYVIFLYGLNIFVISPNKDAKLSEVGLRGALFGLVTYATFDLTSAAVFKDFPSIVVFVDMAWGALLCASISLITSRVIR